MLLLPSLDPFPGGIFVGWESVHLIWDSEGCSLFLGVGLESGLTLGNNFFLLPGNCKVKATLGLFQKKLHVCLSPFPEPLHFSHWLLKLPRYFSLWTKVEWWVDCDKSPGWPQTCYLAKNVLLLLGWRVCALLCSVLVVLLPLPITFYRDRVCPSHSEHPQFCAPSAVLANSSCKNWCGASFQESKSKRIFESVKFGSGSNIQSTTPFNMFRILM